MKQTKNTKPAAKKLPKLSEKQIEILAVIWFCVALFLIIHISFVYGTGGISKGMSYSNALKSQEGQFGFNYYSYFKNSEGNFVVVHFTPEEKVGSRVTEVVCIDARTVKHTEAQFELVKPGMDPIEVARLVGIPFDTAESEHEESEAAEHTYTLYASSSGKVYMAEWESSVNENGDPDFKYQYLKSMTASDATALEEDIPSESDLGLWLSTAADAVLLIGAIVVTCLILFKKKKTN